jgi:hypothetical protein
MKVITFAQQKYPAFPARHPCPSECSEIAQLLVDHPFGFKDLANGGDRNYNIIVVKTTFQTRRLGCFMSL